MVQTPEFHFRLGWCRIGFLNLCIGKIKSGQDDWPPARLALGPFRPTITWSDLGRMRLINRPRLRPAFSLTVAALNRHCRASLFLAAQRTNGLPTPQPRRVICLLSPPGSVHRRHFGRQSPLIDVLWPSPLHKIPLKIRRTERGSSLSPVERCWFPDGHYFGASTQRRIYEINGVAL